MAEASHAVFLSYAAEDAGTAQRICDALRAAGIEVWLDQSELRGGDAWDRQIRERIRDCRLFIALISAHTEARDEGYFRREWKLAVDRTHDMLEKKAFLLPVAIDGTPERGAVDAITRRRNASGVYRTRAAATVAGRFDRCSASRECSVRYRFGNWKAGRCILVVKPGLARDRRRCRLRSAGVRCQRHLDFAAFAVC